MRFAMILLLGVVGIVDVAFAQQRRPPVDPTVRPRGADQRPIYDQSPDLRANRERAERLQENIQRNTLGDRLSRNQDFVMMPALLYDRPSVEGPLKVKKEQKEPYSEFLKQKDTGIFQLMPKEKIYILNAEEEARNKKSDGKEPKIISPESAYYWFQKKVHYRESADLVLRDGYFETGFAGDALGFIISVGDVSLESLDLNNEDVKVMMGLPIPNKPDQLMIAQKNARSVIPAKMTETYLLRSAVYDVSDSLIAFRIVEVAENGNHVVLWKRLYKGEVPKLTGKEK